MAFSLGEVVVHMQKAQDENSSNQTRANQKKDAKALAELIYDVFREKKHKENVIINKDQNNAQSELSN